MNIDALIEFLNARIDKDEDVALDAGGRGTSSRMWGREMIGCVIDADRRYVVWSDGTTSPGEADHIARHDPDRALREVKAKRVMVLACAERLRAYIGTGAQVSLEWLILREFAAIYDDHPDYREEWRP